MRPSRRRSRSAHGPKRPRTSRTDRFQPRGEGLLRQPHPYPQGSWVLPLSVDNRNGMNAVSNRGDALLGAHLASLDPTAANARDRLEDALGAELARKLVWALCSRA